jgi:hypothetical protein
MKLYNMEQNFVRNRVVDGRDFRVSEGGQRGKD